MTPLRRRSWSWLPWVGLLVAAIAGGVLLKRHRAARPLEVRVHRVERGRVRDLVSTVSTGRVAAQREATLRAEIAGRIVRVYHRRGERVAADEALVAYDADELRDRVGLAETAVALARAQVAQAEVSVRLARRNASRATALRDRGATAPAEAESLEGQAEVAVGALASARAAEVQGAANLRIARDALRRAVVHASFAATVLTTSVEEGEVTAPGAPLVAVADMSALHVDGELDEADLGRVAVGMRAEVTLDAFPGERLGGTLAEIAPSVTHDLRGNRAVAIRVDLAVDPRLRVGMSADVDVVVATRDDVLSVPPNAVLGRGSDRAVFLAVRGVARRRPIEVGIATWEAVEVRRGLAEGDAVVVTLASDQLVDGAAVTTRPEEPPPGTAPAAPPPGAVPR